MERSWLTEIGDPKTDLIGLLVYYEVPEGKREELKQKFDHYVRSELRVYQSS